MFHSRVDDWNFGAMYFVSRGKGQNNNETALYAVLAWLELTLFTVWKHLLSLSYYKVNYFSIIFIVLGRAGKKYGFDFQANKDAKVGMLRAFVTEKKAKEKNRSEASKQDGDESS